MRVQMVVDGETVLDTTDPDDVKLVETFATEHSLDASDVITGCKAAFFLFAGAVIYKLGLGFGPTAFLTFVALVMFGGVVDLIEDFVAPSAAAVVAVIGVVVALGLAGAIWTGALVLPT
jgi:hypothetical protein